MKACSEAIIQSKAIATYGDATNDYLLCSTVLRLLILQPTIQSTALICLEISRYYNQLSNLPTIRSDREGEAAIACCALICLRRLQRTICGALLCLAMIQANTSEYLLYSACQYVSRWSRLGTSRRSLPAASRRSCRWVSRRSRRAVSCLRSRRCFSRRSKWQSRLETNKDAIT